MRLIDADLLKETIASNVYPVADAFNSRDYGMFWTGGIEKAIDEQPTIEPKKGKWIDGHRAGYGLALYWYIYCSECLWERDDDDHDKDTPYCPNCGSDMRGEEE